jgi:glutaredoxin 3
MTHCAPVLVRYLDGIAMADVVVYATPYCFYCLRAKQLLAKKGVAFQEVDVGGSGEARGQLAEVTGSRRVPKIFINGELVGGYYELAMMERTGELDALLAATPGRPGPDSSPGRP